MSHVWTDVTSIIFAGTGILLIFVILLQRGRGGGLAGAFGATGGQSAFGTKAGDVFTRITIGIAVVWVALAGLTSWAMVSERSAVRFKSEAPTVEPVPTEKKQAAPAEKQNAPSEKSPNGKAAAGGSSQSKSSSAPSGGGTASGTQAAPPKESGTSPDSPAMPPATK
jgi:preprotein translocase subunit SecG